MASIKLFPSSSNWYACYKIPTTKINGKGHPVFRRMQKSTGTDIKKTAHQMALAFEKAGELAASKQWADRSAQHFLHEINAVTGVRITQVEQAEPFFNRWLEGRVRLTSDSTQLNEKGIIRDFLDHLGQARRIGPLANITPVMVAEFRDGELKKGKAVATINKALSVLAQAFDHAVGVLSLEQNPARRLRLKQKKGSVQERFPFLFEQFCHLVKRTGPEQKSRLGRTVSAEWQTAIVLGGYTGARQQEVMQVTWGQIDFEKETIAIRRAKNGGDLHISPMHPSLKLHLSKLCRPRDPKALVLPGLARLPERSISKAFRETILPRIGISQPYAQKSEQKGVGRKIARYSFHSLRHALSTWLASAGVDEMMRMRIVGHEDEEVSRTYTHTEMVQLAAAIAKVPSL